MIHYGRPPICRVPGAKPLKPTANHLPCAAHGKAHTTTSDRQSRPLPCAIYRAHGKGFAVCNYRPTAKKSRHPGTMTWPGLCRVPVDVAHSKVQIFAVCHDFCTRQRLAPLPCAMVFAHGKGARTNFFCLIITYMVPQKIIYIIMIIPCIRISITGI